MENYIWSILKLLLCCIAINLIFMGLTQAKERVLKGRFDKPTSKHIEGSQGDIFNNLDCKPPAVKSLIRGSSAETYFLDQNEQRDVLRTYKHKESKEKRLKEEYAMMEAGILGFGPKLYSVSPDGKDMLIEYIPGKELTTTEAKKEVHIKALAEAFRKIHATEKNPYAPDDFGLLMHTFYKEIPKDASNAGALEAALDFIQTGSQELKALSTHKVNIHNDLTPRNILFSQGNFYFIDWSEALYEDPLLDLTYFSILATYNKSEEDLLLQSYLQRSPTAEEIKRFAIAKRMNLARLVLGANYAISQLKDENDDTIDPNVELKPWEFYAEYAVDEVMPICKQFFYDLGKAALHGAKSIEIPK